MDNQAAGRVKDLLTKNDKIGILVGKNPSLDQMAGALSLYKALQQSGKNVSIASPSEPIVANSSLVGIDKVKITLSGDGGDLIVSFPYKEGEIEKVSYTLENGYLNIVVKATEEGLTFDQQDVMFQRSGGFPNLLFIVGTARLSDLGTLFDADALKNTAVINIDNQTDNQGFGDVVLVSAQASSISEIIGNLLNSLELEIDQDIAQNLLLGLSQATNNFQDNTTSFLAFELASVCMQKGAKRSPSLVQQLKSQDNTKSPFGPFTMPQSRQQGNQRQQPQIMNKSNRSVQSMSQRGEKPWESKSQQARPQTSFMQQQSPIQQQQMAPPLQPTTLRQDQNDQIMQPKPVQQVEHKDTKEEQPETPPDWLSPKVYKSSTLI